VGTREVSGRTLISTSDNGSSMFDSVCTFHNRGDTFTDLVSIQGDWGSTQGDGESTRSNGESTRSDRESTRSDGESTRSDRESTLSDGGITGNNCGGTLNNCRSTLNNWVSIQSFNSLSGYGSTFRGVSTYYNSGSSLTICAGTVSDGGSNFTGYLKTRVRNIVMTGRSAPGVGDITPITGWGTLVNGGSSPSASESSPIASGNTLIAGGRFPRLLGTPGLAKGQIW
jgi:hypothetical protein